MHLEQQLRLNEIQMKNVVYLSLWQISHTLTLSYLSDRKETFAEFCERLIEKFTTNGKSLIPHNESSENKNYKDILCIITAKRVIYLLEICTMTYLDACTNKYKVA